MTVTSMTSLNMVWARNAKLHGSGAGLREWSENFLADVRVVSARDRPHLTSNWLPYVTPVCGVRNGDG